MVADDPGYLFNVKRPLSIFRQRLMSIIVLLDCTGVTYPCGHVHMHAHARCHSTRVVMDGLR